MQSENQSFASMREHYFFSLINLPSIINNPYRISSINTAPFRFISAEMSENNPAEKSLIALYIHAQVDLGLQSIPLWTSTIYCIRNILGQLFLCICGLCVLKGSSSLV